MFGLEIVKSTEIKNLKTKTGHPVGCPVSFQAIQNPRLWRHRVGGRGRRVVHHVVRVLAGVGGGIWRLADGAEVNQLIIQGVAGQDAHFSGAAPGSFGVLLLAQPLQKLGSGGGERVVVFYAVYRVIIRLVWLP